MKYLEMKKKAILSIVGKVKGFVRSVSGTPPIALEACADNMSIINYKIHGNSIQDGTPSPDNPVEVQSVGELVTDETDINYGKYKIPVTARSESTEPITTNIYLDEPLRKVGDYADYIDFKNGMVVRNISKYPLVMPHPGTIYTKGTNTVLLSFYHGGQGRFVKNSKIFCPIFKNIENAWYLDLETIHNHNESSLNYYCGLAWSRLNLIYDGTKVYRSDDETQTELTDKQITDIATAYLRTISEEYRVVYAIPVTSTETSISLPILPTFKGITTVYEVGTTIQPSNMEAEYYSTLKGE